MRCSLQIILSRKYAVTFALYVLCYVLSDSTELNAALVLKHYFHFLLVNGLDEQTVLLELKADLIHRSVEFKNKMQRVLDNF